MWLEFDRSHVMFLEYHNPLMLLSRNLQAEPQGRESRKHS